jgi:hypothetical protein
VSCRAAQSHWLAGYWHHSSIVLVKAKRNFFLVAVVVVVFVVVVVVPVGPRSVQLAPYVLNGLTRR